MIGIAGSQFSFPSGNTFLPTQLSNLEAWYRSDKGTTLSGSTITTWADQSGKNDASGRNLVLGTAPNYNTSDSDYNGKPSVAFISASSTFLQSGTFSSTISAPYTLYFVGKVTNSFGFIVGNVPPGLSNEFGVWEAGDGGSYVADGTVANPPSTPAVICATFTAGGGIYINNSQTRVGTSVSGPTSFTAVSVGADGGANPVDGTMTELIIYSVTHSTSQIQQVFQYLGSRYNINVS